MSDDPEADRTLVENERSRLTATYVNGLAIAIFAVRGLAPLVSAIMPKPEAGSGVSPEIVLHAVPWGVIGVTAFRWIVGGAPHLAARRSVEDLRA